MTAWEMQLLQSVDGLSEQYRQPLLDMVNIFRKSVEMGKNVSDHTNAERRIGSRKGTKFLADGHDLDEHNAEIEALFGDCILSV